MHLHCTSEEWCQDRTLTTQPTDGKGKARPSGPRMWLGSFIFSVSCPIPSASRFSQNANDINDPSAIHTPLHQEGPERGGVRPGNEHAVKGLAKPGDS
jgi:hypothetical protein